MYDSSVQLWTHNENIGSNHKPNAAINSVEYCIVPNSNHTIQWVVPIGFEMGDTRKIKAHTSMDQQHLETEEKVNEFITARRRLSGMVEIILYFGMHYILSRHCEK
jgi:hypothetical protein